jgi:hypothetical protein
MLHLLGLGGRVLCDVSSNEVKYNRTSIHDITICVVPVTGTALRGIKSKTRHERIADQILYDK